MEIISWLQKWYKENCNGEWEHYYGIEIGTLDNPGWYIKINVKEKEYLLLRTNKKSYEKGADDWYRCYMADGAFIGCGDCLKLEKMIQVFREWMEGI